MLRAMPLSLRPTDTDRAEPKIAAPGPRPIAEPTPMRRNPLPQGREPPNPGRRAPPERQATGLTAGERLTVASAMTGGDAESRRRPGMLRLILLATLIIFAGIGAATVYHSVAGAFPR
jgi:hypothetical protein